MGKSNVGLYSCYLGLGLRKTYSKQDGGTLLEALLPQIEAFSTAPQPRLLLVALSLNSPSSKRQEKCLMHIAVLNRKSNITIDTESYLSLHIHFMDSIM